MIKIILKYLRTERTVPGRALLAAVAAMVLFAVVNPVLLSGAEPQEYQVKAVFITNIAKFVGWPQNVLSDPEEPFRLYILGEDRFGNAFDTLEGRMIHNRPLEVRKLEAWEDIPTDCRILYIGVSDSKEIKRVLDRVVDRAILTVSDVPEFAEAGGIIRLLTESGKVKFSINTYSARGAGLTISSNLLRLAIALHGEVR